MIFSTKVVTQFSTAILTFILGFIVFHLGLQSDAAVTTLLPGFIAIAAGGFAGWFVKEEASPRALELEKEIQDLEDRFLAFTGGANVIESTSAHRSVLSLIWNLEEEVDTLLDRKDPPVARDIVRPAASVIAVQDGTNGPERLTAQVQAGADLSTTPLVASQEAEASGKKYYEPVDNEAQKPV
jgi:hypothetical protein